MLNVFFSLFLFYGELLNEVSEIKNRTEEEAFAGMSKYNLFAAGMIEHIIRELNGFCHSEITKVTNHSCHLPI